MPAIVRSALFRRQLLDLTVFYRENAGSPTALRFVDRIEDSVNFIRAEPLACPVYTRLEGKEFRKWALNGFPVSVFFRIEGRKTIVLEALYGQRMNIAARLSTDIG